MFEYKKIKIKLLKHASFQIKYAKKVIYLDPFKLPDKIDKADIIIASHDHFDHCHPESLKKISDPEKTILITVEQSRDAIKDIKTKEIKYVKPGDTLSYFGMGFEFVPAYNINKFRDSGEPFHPKEKNYFGTIIDFEGNRIYHAGDTDNIPEMQDIDANIALLPISGTYVMTVEEALEAVRSLNISGNLEYVIPMHIGSIVGNSAMAETFKNKADTEVIILDSEA